MKQLLLLLFLGFLSITSEAQINPAITKWLQNTTSVGSYYVKGNSTKISNNILVNCQKIQYSNDWVYVSTKGVPSYPTGPFQDGNPSQASDQNAIFKISLKPTKNNGTPTNTTGGNIGIFINGVALFDYRDGVAWNATTKALCGGPGNPPCPGGMGAQQAWTRDAIPAEKPGFDCSKGHPAMGNYHHHQNPSAFKLDKKVISTVCNLYDADGLYVVNENEHSPLIGFAYDGFPIYGAYAYTNVDGTGPIARMKSGYQLRTDTTRVNGPKIGQVVGNQTMFNGYFREDYEFVTHDNDPTYLDNHNGRFCITPEYPQGIYCYFGTIDENHNSAYPYVVGPTFYGVINASKVNAINETTTNYVLTSNEEVDFESYKISIFPIPSSDFIAVQFNGLVSDAIKLELLGIDGKVVDTKTLEAGSTIAYFETDKLYTGTYIIRFIKQGKIFTQKVSIVK